MAGKASAGLDLLSQQSGSRFRFELASDSDDAELRTLLRNTPMGGQITVTYQREPSYFAAAVVEGPQRTVLTVRDVESNRLVGMGSCSVRSRYVQNREERIGYLGALRVLPEYRSFGLLARGYRFLRDLPLVNSARFHLTTIAEGNQRAIDLLTTGRAGLPFYHYLGRYFTFALALRPRTRGLETNGLEIRSAADTDVDAVVSFLQAEGGGLNLFPCYKSSDFFTVDSTFKNLRAQDISLAFRDGELVGAMGLWDQQPFRQVVVESYDPLRRIMRPTYNAWARLRGMPTFPLVGQTSQHLLVAIPVVRRGDTTTAAALLDHLRSQANHRRHTALMVGAYERDPLWSLLKQEAVFSYVTRVYLVSWDRDVRALEQLAGQNLYLELGCL